MSTGPLAAALLQVMEQACAQKSDKELLDEFLRTRIEGYFRLLVRRCATDLYGRCRKYLPLQDLAEEAVAEAFVALCRQSVPPDNIHAWLKTVAERNATRMVRRELARRQREAGHRLESSMTQPD